MSLRFYTISFKKMKYNNKIFISVFAVIWIVIALTDSFSVFFLDENFFAFRAWEVMAVEGRNFPFRKNAIFEKQIYGDIANMLKIRCFRKFRHQKFSTDSFGFRNQKYADGTYFPIVVLGDSYMAGSSLSDEQTFNSQLSRFLKVPVYNYAAVSPAVFLADERFQKTPPKILIWESGESLIVPKTYQIFSKIPLNKKIYLREQQQSEKQIRRRIRLSEYYAKWIFHDWRWRLTGLYNTSLGYIDEKSGMLYYHPNLLMLQHAPEQEDITVISDGIEHFKQICENRGIKMIYMPVPHKETVYRKFLPEKMLKMYPESHFLDMIHEELDRRGIANVNLMEEFRMRSDRGEHLYFSDDTHWNPEGVSVAVERILDLMKQSGLMPETECHTDIP